MTREEFGTLKVGDVVLDTSLNYTFMLTELRSDGWCWKQIINNNDPFAYYARIRITMCEKYKLLPLYSSPLYLAMQEDDDE